MQAGTTAVLHSSVSFSSSVGQDLDGEWQYKLQWLVLAPSSHSTISISHNPNASNMEQSQPEMCLSCYTDASWPHLQCNQVGIQHTLKFWQYCT